MDQRTPEWFAARTGKITASRIKDVLAVSKRDGKPLQARDDYLTEIVVEILTGQPASKLQTAAMTWGTENEPAAVELYSRLTGANVHACGFMTHAEHEFIGASPDGLLEDGTGIEVKCPFNSSVHLRTIINGMPADHIPQVQAQMWVMALDAVDFVSFDPRMPSHLKLYRQRIERDDVYIKVMESECLKFWGEVQAMLQQLGEKA